MIRPFLCKMIDAARGRHPDQLLKELISFEYLNEEQVKLAQEKKMRAILGHAYAHVPYYREILGRNQMVDSRGRVHMDRFKYLPFLTKGILKGRWEDLKSDDLSRRQWICNHSGGSTGEPAQFIQDEEFHDYVVVIKDLFDGWTGCPPGHKKALLWGSDKDFFGGKLAWRVKFSRWLRNQLWMSSFRMTTENMKSYVTSIGRFKPDQLLGYAGSLYEFSLFIQSQNIPVYSPKAIMASAGTLYPHMKKAIEDVFGVPVFNRYGSREVGDVACECENHKGLHISPLTHYVEIVRPDGSLASIGEEGEIAVTLLTNFAMPLIRYKIGDHGIMSGKLCGCGRAWPLMEKVTGRTSDSFIKKDGGIVSGECFINLFYPFVLVPDENMIRRYQIIQEDYDAVSVKLVLFSGFDLLKESLLKEIEKRVKLVMGSSCQVNFDILEDIPPSPSGKHRYVYSLINNEPPLSLI